MSVRVPLKGTIRVPLKGTIRVPLKGTIRVPLKGTIRVPLRVPLLNLLNSTLGFIRRICRRVGYETLLRLLVVLVLKGPTWEVSGYSVSRSEQSAGSGVKGLGLGLLGFGL